MENKYIERSLLSAFRELQIKMTMKYHYTPIKMAKSKILTAPKAKNVEKH